eukprot:m.96006 g.96006  ORF g.96006 m.96006 type:complete len:211 (+) comp12451_c0_seq1:108-740(+)
MSQQQQLIHSEESKPSPLRQQQQQHQQHNPMTQHHQHQQLQLQRPAPCLKLGVYKGRLQQKGSEYAGLRHFRLYILSMRNNLLSGIALDHTLTTYTVSGSSSLSHPIIFSPFGSSRPLTVPSLEYHVTASRQQGRDTFVGQCVIGGAVYRMSLQYDTNVRPLGSSPPRAPVTTALTLDRISSDQFSKMVEFRGYKDLSIVIKARVWVCEC